MSNYPTNPQGYPQMTPPPMYLASPQMVQAGPRRYSIFGAMIRVPFFNADVSRDVARNWTGIGFWYLFLLLAITWVIVLIKVHFAFAAFVRNDLSVMVRDIPPITISNGHVSSNVDQPYTIKSHRTGKTVAVLDTTGTINSLDDTDADVLVTDHKVWTRTKNGNDLRQYDLSKVKYFYVDKARITGWVRLVSRWLAIGLFPIVLIASLIWRLIVTLIYGAINMAFSSGFKANLSYAAAMRLAAVSLTPTILLNTVLWLTGASFPGSWLIGICISLIYMVLAVRANGNETPPPTRGFPVAWPTQ